MEPSEAEWLDRVEAQLGISGPEAAAGEAPRGIGLTDRDATTLLRIAKVAADATGVRYLAPLTTFLVGRSMGEQTTGGTPRTLQQVAAAIDDLAKMWSQARTGNG